MLEKRSIIGSINVTATGHVEVRRDDYVLENGVPIGRPQFHRHVLAPGESLAGQDERVFAVAAAVWTPAVLADEAARQAATTAAVGGA